MNATAVNPAVAASAQAAEPSHGGEVILTLRRRPDLRLDLRRLEPGALAALGDSQIAAIEILDGARRSTIGEWFAIERTPAAGAGGALTLRLRGDGLDRCDRIGTRMQGGAIVVEGSAGDHVGLMAMQGSITVAGDVGRLAACEMAGATLHVKGDAGDFLAGAQPGSMDGMRGGTVIVDGNAGARLADRMRRGTVVVRGNAGDFAASRMVAGTLVVGGSFGAHPGLAMRRGSVVALQSRPQLGAAFMPAGGSTPVFWQLLARDLQKHGGALTDLAKRPMQRWLGDVSAGGKGEFLLVG